MKQVQVHMRSVANASLIRREKRNGRDVIIVPSATLPDDIVMAGNMGPVLYPADEIKKAFKGLERTPAPLGHPTVNGRFVSASDPEGINLGWFGAWNENVRQEGGRVLLDKVIDVEVANRSDGGKAVLAAIEAQKPIHTSTGLLARMEVSNSDTKHKYVVRDMVMDHDALILDGQGAATPDDGVGIFVNTAGDEVEVINCDLGDEFERDLNWAADSALRAVERMERVPLLEKIKQAIKDAVTGVTRLDIEPTGEPDRETYAVNEEQFNELKAQVDTLATGFAGIGDTIALAVTNAMKPVTDAMAATAADAKAKADADKAALVNTVVTAGLLDAETAAVADIAVLNALAEKAKPGVAFTLNGAFKPSGDKPSFKLPEGE